jgi:hypothetical protein
LNGKCDDKIPSYQEKLLLQKVVNSLKPDSNWNDCYLKIKENGLDKVKYFDLRITNCIWNDKPSLLILFDEIS